MQKIQLSRKLISLLGAGMILSESIEGLKDAINKAIKSYADAGILFRLGRIPAVIQGP